MTVGNELSYITFHNHTPSNKHIINSKFISILKTKIYENPNCDIKATYLTESENIKNSLGESAFQLLPSFQSLKKVFTRCQKLAEAQSANNPLKNESEFWEECKTEEDEPIDCEFQGLDDWIPDAQEEGGIGPKEPTDNNFDWGTLAGKILDPTAPLEDPPIKVKNNTKPVKDGYLCPMCGALYKSLNFFNTHKEECAASEKYEVGTLD